MRVFSTRPHFLGLADSAPPELDLGPLTMTKASPGTMVVLCEGRKGDGFYVCGTCGAGFRDRTRKHRTPFGTACSGTLQRTALGHTFVTDVVRLAFSGVSVGFDTDPMWIAHSLSYALLEGASSVLEVPPADLNTTVAYARNRTFPPIVLYDNVPGGAGLVSRLEDPGILRACFEAALERVSGGCGCGENESCYGCLRSYRNQFVHQELRRGPVKEYLIEHVLGGLG